MSLRVLASLRSADLDALDRELEALTAGGIDGLHLDVMDGIFVPEESFSPEFCAALRGATQLPLDVHLMVAAPEEWIGRYVAAGADRVAFHVEATQDPRSCLEQIREAGAQPGLVCFPGTPLSELDPLLPHISVVNPLGVDPRQKLGFQDSTYRRIRQLVSFRERHQLDFAVQADGGVWEKTRDGLVEAGADELVGGYPIFSAVDYGVAIGALRGRA